jgi:hypothetical protein
MGTPGPAKRSVKAMSFSVVCNSCRTKLLIPEEGAGQRVTCPRCGSPLYIAAIKVSSGGQRLKGNVPDKHFVHKYYLAPLVTTVVSGVVLAIVSVVLSARRESAPAQGQQVSPSEPATAQSVRNAGPGGPVPAAASTFAVVSARFGTGQQWADVTAQVKHQIRDGRLQMTVPYHGDELRTIGFPDPAPNREKLLIIDYIIDGRPGRATFAARQPIRLPL